MGKTIAARLPVVGIRPIAVCIASLLLLFSCQKPEDNPVFKAATKARPEIRASTRFELLSPEKTGIRFSPTIIDDYRYNFSMDPYIYNGGGVAVLDVNNDGLQDLFFTARLQGCRLYLNKGNLNFEDISEKSGVASFIGLKTGATVVDINADGWQDLYVCRTWLDPLPERRNLLFVNNHDGTFSEKAKDYGLDDLSASQHATFFDYDLDGDLDCYVLNHPVAFKTMNNLDLATDARSQKPRGEYESDRLYENTGKGRFVDVTARAGLSNRAFGLSVLASDFNGDGYPDLFVGNDFVMPDFLYLNDGKGHFRDVADTWLAHTSNHTMGADYADLDNDGFSDLVSLDMLAAPRERRQRLMNTMILERDRQMQQSGYGRQAMRNTLQLNRHNSGFSECGYLAGMYATDWSWAPLVADYDNDGHRDLFISNGIKRDMNDLDFFIYTADSINKTGGISPKRFASFEAYVGLMPSQPVHNYLFQNTGTFPLSDVSEAWGFTQTGFSNGAAYADLDNDGDLDLITNNLEAPPGVYENKAVGINANHWLQIKCKGSALNPFGNGAKVRVYAGGALVFAQEMTPVRGFYSSVEPVLQVGLGQISRIDKIEIDWQEGKHQIVENPPADQRILLDFTQSRPGKCPQNTSENTAFFLEIPDGLGIQYTHRENDFEDFDREKLLTHRFSRPGPALATADLNGDGLDDVFVGGASGQAGAVFFQTTEGRFRAGAQPALEADSRYEDAGAAFFDADGDGDPDLYVSSGGNEQDPASGHYQDRLYLNDGQGGFSRAAQALPAENASGACVRIADFNRDGRPDVFVGGRVVPGRYPEKPQSLLLQNMGGTFTEVCAELAPELQFIGMIADLQFADLNGDQTDELIATGDWLPICVFEWDGSRYHNATAKFGLENTHGWWNCLLAADVDGDGDTDLVGGNEGLNTRFQASPGAPLRLFAADFDTNGSIDPVLCQAENGKYYPVATRDQLAAQLGALIKKKFTRYATYARASITDVLPAKDLLAARLLEAHILQSSVFENRNGKFVRHDLPAAAQMAPVQCLAFEDLDGDGQRELLLAGNDLDTDIETYQLDGFYEACVLRLRTPDKPEVLGGGFRTAGAVRQLGVVSQKNGRKLWLVAGNDMALRVYELKQQE